MARSFLVVALTSLLPAAFALADPTPPPSPPPPPPPPAPSPAESPRQDWRGKRDPGPRDMDMDGDRRPPPPLLDNDSPLVRFKKRLEEMSPDERQHFQDNWKRWKQMGEGEQKDWQGRAAEERERMKKVIDDTIQKLGLKLDADQREVFVLRYRQERRKIEEQLRKEMDDKRESEINEMLQRLKGEFSTAKPAPAPGTAKPAATP